MSDTPDSICEIVRKNEQDFLRGTTHISTYVDHSMSETLDRIDAYLNSKHISGPKDSLGRDKPFFNIVIAAVNIWYRATDIDRKNIKIRATKAQDWIMSLVATAHVQEWMRREQFGTFLNEWGRTLARYGSAVDKIVENSFGLHISVIPWGRLIVDPVDFEGNVKIEILELTPAQLRRRVQTHGYDRDQVKALIDASSSAERETTRGERKDNKAGYIKVYEVHGELSRYLLTNNEGDTDSYEQQMHVVSFVAKKENAKEYDEFTLFKGPEQHDPYGITHLMAEDGRTLSIGAVERLFESQWQVNHSKKGERDALDLGNKLIWQTADPRFVNRNVLGAIETGAILVHADGKPLTKVDTSKTDIVNESNYAVSWKQLGNEIVGVSDAMLGAMPKSGTAWRQTEALLQESYSLFDLMTENKGLALEDRLRRRILTYIKKQMDTSEEVSATLAQYDIDRIDRMYVKREAIKKTNGDILSRFDDMLNGTGEPLQPGEQDAMQQNNEISLQQGMSQLGDQRFFKPSEIPSKTWKSMFKDLEWDIEIDITGESRDVQEALQTLNMALQLVMMPGFDQNPRAKALVGRALEFTSVMSPMEFNAMPAATIQPIAPTPAAAGPTALSSSSLM